MHTKEAICELPVERRIEDFASRVASAIRTAAIPALDGFASFLRVRRGFQFRETVEPIECGLYPVRVDRVGELVRVDLNLSVGIPSPMHLRELLRMELEPFIVGAGYVTVEDTAEGIVVLRRDVSDDKVRHGSSSIAVRQTDNPPNEAEPVSARVLTCLSCEEVIQIDPQMREACLRELRHWDRRFDGPETIFENLLLILGYSQTDLPARQAPD